MKMVKIKLAKFVYALREWKENTNMKAAYYEIAYWRLKYGIILWRNNTDTTLYLSHKKCVRAKLCLYIFITI